MKHLLFGLVLLMVCNSAIAQIYRPSPFVTPSAIEWSKRNEIYVYNEGLSYFWWMCTYPQVRDKVVAEPGWDVYALDEGFDTYSAMAVVNKQQKVTLEFYFSKPRQRGDIEKLYRRRFSYQPDSQMVDEWSERLAKLPYDSESKCWIDEPHYARIVKGVNDYKEVVFELTLYLPEKVTPSAK